MHNRLPKIFCFINEFKSDYIKNLNKNVAIIYRNYDDETSLNELKSFASFCKKKKQKFYLSNNIALSLKLNLDGTYIPAFNKTIFKKKFLNRKFNLIGSAHNIKEIKIKESQGVKLIFLSPLFKDKNKKMKLGICKFNLLTSITKKKVIALGGIDTNNLKQLKMTKSYGYASISYFKKLHLKMNTHD